MAKAKKQIELRRQGRAHVVRIGEREIETRGLSESFWTDLYHRSMTVYWPVFFGTAAAIFIILNALFAFLYWLGDEPIANVAGNEPLGLFYFSIETLATVGYGDMHPQTHYGHFIATVEIFTGMSFLAVMTGLFLPRGRKERRHTRSADWYHGHARNILYVALPVAGARPSRRPHRRNIRVGAARDQQLHRVDVRRVGGAPKRRAAILVDA